MGMFQEVGFFMAGQLPVGQYLLIIDTSRSHTHTHTLHSVGLLRMSDQPDAETATWRHTTLTTDRHPCPPAGFQPAFPASERPQTYVLDRAATGIRKEVLVSDKQSEAMIPAGTKKRDGLIGPQRVGENNTVSPKIVWSVCYLTALHQVSPSDETRDKLYRLNNEQMWKFNLLATDIFF